MNRPVRDQAAEPSSVEDQSQSGMARHCFDSFTFQRSNATGKCRRIFAGATGTPAANQAADARMRPILPLLEPACYAKAIRPTLGSVLEFWPAVGQFSS